MDDAIEKQMLQYRKDHFEVKIYPSRHPLEKGEMNLSTTTNGYQWTTISLLQGEIDQVIEALQQAKLSLRT